MLNGRARCKCDRKARKVNKPRPLTLIYPGRKALTMDPDMMENPAAIRQIIRWMNRVLAWRLQQRGK